MENILEIKNLTKEYNDFKLDNISFDVKKGYIMGFIGPNGSGKTTTIKLIMNLIKKQSGQINIFGLDNEFHDKEIKSRIGFVYDECSYFDHLSVMKNAKVIAPFYKDWDNELFNSYIKRFNLNPKKKLSKLSKGMKTKFSLAVALSHNADLIIMDEPTAGLDPIFRRELLDILYDLIQDENKSIFFSTHITSDLDRIADYITFINKGKIVFSKSTDDINDNYRLIKGPNEWLTSLDTTLLIGVKKNRYGFEALTNSSDLLISQFSDNLVIEKPSLEDIMIHYGV